MSLGNHKVTFTIMIKIVGHHIKTIIILIRILIRCT